MDFDLNDVDMRKLFEHFDADQNGNICYEEFIQGIRDPLNPRRMGLVHQAFDCLDADGSGAVEPHEVVTKFDPSKHPEVLSGAKTKDQVLREFLDTFDVGGEKDGKVTRKEFENYYRNISASIDLDDYFELMMRNAWHISGGEGACANSANKRVLVTGSDGKQRVVEIEDDLGLDLVPEKEKKTWMMKKLKEQGVDAVAIEANGSMEEESDGKAPQKGNFNPTFTSSIRLAGVGAAPGRNRVGKRATAYHKKGVIAVDHWKPSQTGNSKNKKVHHNLAEVEGSQGVTAILERLKKQLAARGARGIIGLGRKFRIIDDDGSKSINKEEFQKATAECALDLNDTEVDEMFNFFDKDGSGGIDFEEFLGGIRGGISPRRMEFIQKAFDLLDINNDGFVEPFEIVERYSADKHPDVISGRKTAEEVMREFLDTFEVGGEKDGKVTRKEFENYYRNISASIDLDDYFELMMRNAWHISGGEGACANSANKRVLVTGSDGKQRVVEIEDDLGLDLVPEKEKKTWMMKKLKEQGVDAVAIETNGAVEED